MASERSRRLGQVEDTAWLARHEIVGCLMKLCDGTPETVVKVL